MLEQLPGLIYAVGIDSRVRSATADTIYANLYAGNHAEMKLGNRTVKIVQDTRQPWDGDVSLTIDPEGAGPFTVAVRIPGWAREQPIAGDLYRFADTAGEPASISVRSRNAEPQHVPLDVRDGYVRIRRNWKRGGQSPPRT